MEHAAGKTPRLLPPSTPAHTCENTHPPLQVAHRLSTVQACDRIYVLREGLVAEYGTHAALLAARGIYHDMWEMQRVQAVLEEHLGLTGAEAGSPTPSHSAGQQEGPEDGQKGGVSPPGGGSLDGGEEAAAAAQALAS